MQLRSENEFSAAYRERWTRRGARRARARERAAENSPHAGLHGDELRTALAAELAEALESEADQFEARAAASRCARRARARKRTAGNPLAGLHGDELRDAELTQALEAELDQADARAAGKPYDPLTNRQNHILYKHHRTLKSVLRYGADDPWAPHQKNFLLSHKQRTSPDGGYYWPGSSVDPATGEITGQVTLINGRYYQDMRHSTQYRSTHSHNLQRILASVPKNQGGKKYRDKDGNKRQRLLSGPAKDDRRHYNSKQAALELPHIAATSIMKDMMRVELDQSFSSYEELIGKLLIKVEEGVIPCLPHVIDWIPDDRYPAGTVRNPHLIWILPDGKAVYGKFSKQQWLFDKVVAGLTYALRDLGADPGGLANVSDFKNPISEHCDYRDSNTTHYPDLSEMAECLDLSYDRATAARAMSLEALGAAGLTEENSQRFWSWATKAGFIAARDLWQANKRRWDPRSPEYDGWAFPTAIERVLTDNVPREIAPKNSRERDALKKAIQTRAEFAAENFDPEKLEDAPVNRGAAVGRIKPEHDKRARHQIGQIVGAENKIIDSRQAVTDAVRKTIKAGQATTLETIATIADRHVNTVRKYITAARYQVYAELAADEHARQEARNNLQAALTRVQDTAHTPLCLGHTFDCREGVSIGNRTTYDQTSDTNQTDNEPPWLTGPPEIGRQRPVLY